MKSDKHPVTTFAVYLMKYIYGAHYVGVNVDPVNHVKQFNERKINRCKAELLYVIPNLSMRDAIHLQLNLKNCTNQTIEEYFKEHGQKPDL